ncbi:sensor histidine kinase [Kocuria sp. JC486]|uniref:sensor histidine kinase n=1 Tax=Kocuria sp. JC486 TaxID=1970736 RepID=UPI0014202939|nr:sensor histidine kinase [Kocuria sp. JC486]NHU85920.1 sensor histidine kinase [Kocuria sp. JC486]
MSLARRFLLMQLLLVLGITVIVAVVLVDRTSSDVEDKARSVTRATTLTLSEDQWIAEQAKTEDPHSTLQPLADELVADSDIDWVTIMDTDGTRWTHPWPEYIGKPYSGSIDAALDGELSTTTEMGQMGMSARTIAPVRDQDGEIVALVATGVLLDNIAADSWAQVPLLIAIALVLFLAASAVTAGLSRYLSRVTGGRQPEELAEAVAVQDAVLERAAQGLLLVDDGRLVLANPRARELLDIDDNVLSEPRAHTSALWRMLERRRARGVKLTDLDLPEELVALLLAEENVLERWVVVGEHTLIVSTTPASKPSNGTVAVVRDHTELSRLSGQLQSTTLMADALRSQTHEHANRMHTVVSLLELNRPEEALHFASEDLRRSRGLAGDVESAVTDPVLAALLLGKTSAAHERGVRLDVSVHGDPPPLPFTPGETVTVVGNLIDNAVDALVEYRDGSGPQTGTTDPAAHTEAPTVEVELTEIDDGGHPAALLTVADNGPGISPDLQESVFQRGFSTKPVDNGDPNRGVGLALVRTVVERHGGSIEFHDDGGAVFVVTVPLAATETPGHGEAVPAASPRVPEPNPTHVMEADA